MASKTEPGRDVPVSAQSRAKAPAVYQGFDGQYIDGAWRPGKHGGVQVDTDPYSGAMLAETVTVKLGYCLGKIKKFLPKYCSRQMGIGNPMRLQPRAWSLRFGTGP